MDMKSLLCGVTTDFGQAHPGSPFGDVTEANAEVLHLVSAVW